MTATLATIPFHGDDLLVADVDGRPQVVLNAAFTAIGLDAATQVAKVQQQHWARTGVTPVRLPGDPRTRNVITSDVRTFLMALATIPLSRVAEHVRPKLAAYQCEVADVIEAHFTADRHAATVPNTVTWDEATALIRQRYGIDLDVTSVTRGLRDAGVLKQNGSPKKAYRDWFWHTGSAWTLHPHILPELTRKLVDTRRALGDMQSQLQLDLALDEQLRHEMRALPGGSEATA
ncbi:MAG: phage antirepressor N-terminal domain-containing protein [Mycobacterium sp.]